MSRNRNDRRLPPPPTPLLDQAPRVPALPLPAEIITSIFEHALPLTSDLSASALQARNLLLYNCSLVCRAWYTQAQPLLFIRLYLPRPSQAWKFYLTVIASPKATKLADSTDFLRMGKYDDDNEDAQDDTFRKAQARVFIMRTTMHCTSLTELWLVDMPAPLDPAQLSVAVSLKKLFLESLILTVPKPNMGEEDYAWYFPRLQSLSLDSVVFEGRLEDRKMDFLLHPRSLPALHSLCLIWATTDSFPYFPDLAPQIEKLFILRRPNARPANTRPSFPIFPLSMQHCTPKLLNLAADIHFESDWQTILNLPTALETLSIGTEYGPQVEHQICTALGGDSSIAHIEMLYLGVELKDLARRAGTIQACAEAGITVLERGRVMEDGRDYVNWLKSLP